MKPMILAYIAISLHKAGDNAKARTVIEQAHQVTKELPDEREKQGAMAHIARGMAETGDLNGALELIQSLDKYGSQGAIDEIVESFTDQESGEAWLPTAGIKITIGAPSRKIKDREAARGAAETDQSRECDERSTRPGAHAVDACPSASEGG